MSLLMLRNLKQLQTRSFHTSQRVLEEWRKPMLRRMKKADLIKLAKENNLDVSGTKTDIIVELLSYQTAKIVGSSTPTLHSIKKALEKEPEPVKEDSVDADKEWMNAFEMKVAQRGGGKSPFQQQKAPFDKTTISKPHPMNDNLYPKVAPSITSRQEEEPVEESEKDDTKLENGDKDDDDDMNKEWVKAFDLKVGSRASRRPHIDTLTPSAPTISESLDEITFDSLKTLDQPSKNDHPIKPVAQESEKDAKKDHPTLPKNQKQSGSLITTVIGSSMLVWYFGGSEGFSNIWHFFSS